MIRVVVDDLAFLPSDAIVRPTTARLDPTTPAVSRLEGVGGAEFTNRLHVQQELVVGAAVVTAGGGDLPAQFVIHAIIQSDTEPISRDGVARAWRSALQRAREWEFATLTAPPLGIGAGNLSVEESAEVMVPVLKSHLGSASFPDDVAIVVETPADQETIRQLFAAFRDSGFHFKDLLIGLVMALKPIEERFDSIRINRRPNWRSLLSGQVSKAGDDVRGQRSGGREGRPGAAEAPVGAWRTGPGVRRVEAGRALQRARSGAVPVGLRNRSRAGARYL